VSYAHATTCRRYIARTGTEQRRKRYLHDRVPLGLTPLTRGLLGPGWSPLAWPFLLAARMDKANGTVPDMRGRRLCSRLWPLVRLNAPGHVGTPRIGNRLTHSSGHSGIVWLTLRLTSKPDFLRSAHFTGLSFLGITSPPKADINRREWNVRFTPESGHQSA